MTSVIFGQIRQKLFHPDFNFIADLPELLGWQILGIGQIPIKPVPCPDGWTAVTTTHGDRRIIVRVWKILQSFRAMLRQIVADLLHRLDGLRIDDARRIGASAVDVDCILTVHSSEGFRHLTAARVLDTNEQDLFLLHRRLLEGVDDGSVVRVEQMVPTFRAISRS